MTLRFAKIDKSHLINKQEVGFALISPNEQIKERETRKSTDGWRNGRTDKKFFILMTFSVSRTSLRTNKA